MKKCIGTGGFLRKEGAQLAAIKHGHSLALYCALRHQDDFSAGIIAAVNHNGDNDSTGAVTGNILRASDPKACKDLGRLVKGFDSKVWDKVCYDVVKAGNRAKFAQNEALRDALLATGDAILAEAAPNDKKWGIVMTAAVAEKTPQADWNGKNLLGKVLMELREEFRRGEA